MPFLHQIIQASFAVILLAAAPGCSVAPDAVEAASVVGPPSEPGQTVVSDIRRIRILSEPSGALVVVDGRPIGPTPLDLDVEAGVNGFFKTSCDVRIRFLQGEGAGDVITVEESFGVRDRVPTELRVTPKGARRVYLSEESALQSRDG